MQGGLRCGTLTAVVASSYDMVSTREQAILFELWTRGPASRLDLARRLGLTPNLAGDLVAGMIKRNLVRECDKSVRGRGRPSIPVEIETANTHILGLALRPGWVQVGKINLRGQGIGTPKRSEVPEPQRLVQTATRLLESQLAAETFAVGVSVTGFVDAEHQRLLLSSALRGLPDADLSPMFRRMEDRPILIRNDMHALAARWLLTQHTFSDASIDEDALLVLLDDGQVGSTLLINGRPNDGCVMGANEMGHMRFRVKTDLCYCGAVGCIERIFSSEYARARLGMVGHLRDMVARYDGRRGPMGEMISLVSNALGNVVNFVRPHRLVITSPFTQHTIFANELLKRTRECFLPALADRVRIDLWEQPIASPAETAGFLPLARMLLRAWSWHCPAQTK